MRRYFAIQEQLDSLQVSMRALMVQFAQMSQEIISLRREVGKPADEKEPLAPANPTTENTGTEPLPGTLQGEGTPAGTL